MEVREELKYTATHEWVKDLGNGLWEVGITDFAQSELGDIVFINLPEVGDEVVKEEAFGDIESVHAYTICSICQIKKEKLKVKNSLP